MLDFAKHKKRRNIIFYKNLLISFLITVGFLIPVDAVLFTAGDVQWLLYLKYFVIFHTGSFLWHLFTLNASKKNFHAKYILSDQRQDREVVKPGRL